MMNQRIKVVYFHRKPRKQNFSVENLFTEIRNNLPPEIDPVISEASYFSNGFFRRLYITVEASLRQKWGDLNHITGDTNFIGLFFKKKKTILTILDVGFMKHPNPIARWILGLFWIKIPVKRAGVVTTISESTKQELLKYVKCDPDKIKVIYIPVSSNFQKVDKPFNSECPTILQVGTKPNKNLDRLIEAIKDIKCHLDIVGELNQDTLSRLEEYKINYTNASGITEQELINKYVQCDMLAFVSTYEGFGMPIVEANIVGRPVITSNILSMPEVAGDSAELVDPFEYTEIQKGILRIMNNSNYRQLLINTGFKNQKRFENSSIAKCYSELYQTLI